MSIYTTDYISIQPLEEKRFYSIHNADYMTQCLGPASETDAKDGTKIHGVTAAPDSELKDSQKWHLVYRDDKRKTCTLGWKSPERYLAVDDESADAGAVLSGSPYIWNINDITGTDNKEIWVPASDNKKLYLHLADDEGGTQVNLTEIPSERAKWAFNRV